MVIMNVATLYYALDKPVEWPMTFDITRLEALETPIIHNTVEMNST